MWNVYKWYKIWKMLSTVCQQTVLQEEKLRCYKCNQL